MSRISRPTALRIANDIAADLRGASDALRRRDAGRAEAGAAGDWLEGLRRQIRGASGRAILAPAYDVERVRVALKPGEGQGPPAVVATLEGTVELTTYAGSPSAVVERRGREPFERTFELALVGDRSHSMRRTARWNRTLRDRPGASSGDAGAPGRGDGIRLDLQPERHGLRQPSAQERR